MIAAAFALLVVVMEIGLGSRGSVRYHQGNMGKGYMDLEITYSTVPGGYCIPHAGVGGIAIAGVISREPGHHLVTGQLQLRCEIDAIGNQVGNNALACTVIFIARSLYIYTFQLSLELTGVAD